MGSAARALGEASPDEDALTLQVPYDGSVRSLRPCSTEPEEFAEAITQIDEALKNKIRDLTRHRRRIAELAGGERLFLPAEIVDALDQLRTLGVSEQAGNPAAASLISAHIASTSPSWAWLNELSQNQR
jgi:hypothetical protein